MFIKKFIFYKDISEFASYVIVIIGFIFAIYQYSQMVNLNKIKETLSYEERLNSGKYLEAKVSIANAWAAYQTLFEKLKQKGVGSQENKEKIVVKISQTIIKEKKLSNNIDLMVDFYEGLYICIKNDICDKKTAFSFLSPYAKKFYDLHHFYIDKKSENYIKGYAKGLKKIMKNSI